MEQFTLLIEGEEYKLPDVSEEIFEQYLFKDGFSDIEYRTYLRDNGIHELGSFAEEAIKDGVLIVKCDNGRIIKFKAISDEDK